MLFLERYVSAVPTASQRPLRLQSECSSFADGPLRNIITSFISFCLRFFSKNNEEGSDEDDESENYGSDLGSSSSESGPTSKYIRSKSWMKYSEALEDEQPGDVKPSTELTNMSMISKALRGKSMLKCPKRVSRIDNI